MDHRWLKMTQVWATITINIMWLIGTTINHYMPLSNENQNGDNCLVNPWQEPAEVDLLSKVTETPDVSLDDA